MREPVNRKPPGAPKRSASGGKSPASDPSRQAATVLPPPPTSPPSTPPGAAAPEGVGAALNFLSGEQRAAIETLSINLARAAMTAQAAIAEAALRSSEKRSVPTSVDPFELGGAWGEVMTRLAT